MKTLSIAVLLLTLGVVVLGFYRGWFALSSDSGPDNKVKINLTLDPDKAKEDAAGLKNETK